MNATPRKGRRLPGEIAFDRCFVPVATLFVVNVVLFTLEAEHGRLGRSLVQAEVVAHSSPPEWYGWLFGGVGAILAFLWVRALVTLVRAWNDPSSRVLRFSAVVLLMPFAFATLRFLLAPFQ